MGVGALKPAVFLDRDGVVNRALVRDGKPHPPQTLEDLEVLPDTPDLLARLKVLGFSLVVVTNQPDVARGTQQRSVIDAMHQHLNSRLPLDAFYVCDHDDADRCPCRKPKPGLLLRAADDLALALNESFLIGDRWRDIDAGTAAGVRPIWIDYGYAERGPATVPFARVKSLKEAVEQIESAVKR
ncbi:MAG TPA: HAD family hydrolase [Bryobacteraceae bacterium]|nr:HAD family hydrolase [Bryobacteraceae bacterium]